MSSIVYPRHVNVSINVNATGTPNLKVQANPTYVPGCQLVKAEKLLQGAAELQSVAERVRRQAQERLQSTDKDIEKIARVKKQATAGAFYAAEDIRQLFKAAPPHPADVRAAKAQARYELTDASFARRLLARHWVAVPLVTGAVVGAGVGLAAGFLVPALPIAFVVVGSIITFSLTMLGGLWLSDACDSTMADAVAFDEARTARDNLIRQVAEKLRQTHPEIIQAFEGDLYPDEPSLLAVYNALVAEGAVVG